MVAWSKLVTMEKKENLFRLSLESALHWHMLRTLWWAGGGVAEAIMSEVHGGKCEMTAKSHTTFWVACRRRRQGQKPSMRTAGHRGN